MYLFFGPMDMQKSEKAHPGDLGFPFSRSNLQGFVRSSCEFCRFIGRLQCSRKEANVVLYWKTQWQHIWRRRVSPSSTVFLSFPL